MRSTSISITTAFIVVGTLLSVWLETACVAPPAASNDLVGNADLPSAASCDVASCMAEPSEPNHVQWHNLQDPGPIDVIFAHLRGWFRPYRHSFHDNRELTEEVAVEITKRALQAEGYEIELLTPKHFRARQQPEKTVGNVLWVTPPSAERPRVYNVRFEKHGDDMRCWVYWGK